jgi:secreted trypsin-like serine protease
VLLDTERIVGGSPAGVHEFPFIVSLQLSKELSPSYRHGCAGVILNKHWIVTAGHCSTFLRIRYRIVAGVYDLDQVKEPYPASIQIVKPLYIVTHPLYNR